MGMTNVAGSSDSCDTVSFVDDTVVDLLCLCDAPSFLDFDAYFVLCERRSLEHSTQQ